MPLYTTTTRWERVRKGHCCPICQHPDWCSIAADGSACICMRIQAGSVKRTQNGGFLHLLKHTERKRSNTWTVTLPDRSPTRSDLAALSKNYQAAVNPARLNRLAERLGLSVTSLRRLGIGWAFDHRAWSFPMTDATGSVLGIRLRLESGRKFAIAGGRDGLFIPSGLAQGEPLLITEGPTDCAAMLDLGLAAVGRPSCTGGVRLLIELLKARRPRQVIIVADNDKPTADGRRPGIDGAEALASVLVAYCPTLRVVLPPAGLKDARAWKQAGATAADVDAAVAAAPVRKLATTARIVNRKGLRHGN